MRKIGLLMFCFFVSILFVIGNVSCNSSPAYSEDNSESGEGKIKVLQLGYPPEGVKQSTELFTEITGIEVELDFKTYDELQRLIKMGIYDVFNLDLVWTAEFAEEGYCLPLDDRIKSFKDGIAPAIWDAFTYKGKVWAIPFLASIQLFFYNMELVKKAGFDIPPKTLEDMVTQMKVMKEKGIVDYPWSDSWNEKEGLVCEFVWLTGAFGGDTFNENGKPIFNTGAGLKAMEFMVKLIDDGLADPLSLDCNEDMTKDLFINAETVFNTNWTYQYSLMNDPTASKIVGSGKMGLIPVSQEVKKYNTSSVSGFQGIAISAKSKNKESAWKFVRYITSPLFQRAHLEELPFWTSIQTDPFVNKLDNTISVKGQQLSAVHHRPKVPKYSDVSRIMQKYIHIALEKSLTPKQALDLAVKEINSL